MGFEILNTEKQPILINELDKDAATLWNKEVDARHYAHPKPTTGDEVQDAMYLSMNWFDYVGYNIHANQAAYTKNYKQMTWDMVKESLLLTQFNVVKGTAQQLENMRMYLKPYFDLIDLWESKGYTPKRVED